MEFYEVLEKRRTIRDFSDREVPEEVLNRILSAAFKAPTNDHLRQMEFIVVRDHARIAEILSPMAGNIKGFTEKNVEALADVMDKDEYAMFVNLSAPSTLQSQLLELFRLHVGGDREYPACHYRRRTGLRFAYPNRARSRTREAGGRLA